jgi:hypothetical protein
MHVQGAGADLFAVAPRISPAFRAIKAINSCSLRVNLTERPSTLSSASR